MLVLLVLCAFISGVGCAALLRFGQESARRYGLLLPQRFHAGHVPRLGGVAMLLACACGWAWMVVGERYFGIVNSIAFSGQAAGAWCVVAMVGVAAGVVDDLTQQVRARSRFVSTALAALLACVVFGLAVVRTEIPGLDGAWKSMPWLGVAVAFVALSGLPHAFNLIDGYNGLAGLVALICCLAIAYVSLLAGDRQLAGIVVVMAGATVGFLLWNYPYGLIFAGDGGAYLWGIVIGVASIQLVQRHPEVSPWFPVLLLIYPIWEACFSIYRKVVRGQSPSLADALHFHQLIYRRVVRQVFHDDAARRMLIRNNRTSPWLWGFAVLTVIPAVLFWRNTPVLMAFTALFIISYLWAYHSIVRFRMQRWLRRARRLYPR
jgi:UDP-GlcNAc:undecaprenyl-phosphate GlcNAc-1-phosphate transferase